MFNSSFTLESSYCQNSLVRLNLLVGLLLRGARGWNVVMFLLFSCVSVVRDSLCKLLLSTIVLVEIVNTCLPMLVRHNLFTCLICESVIHFTLGVNAWSRLTIVWLRATFRDPRTATVYVYCNGIRVMDVTIALLLTTLYAVRPTAMTPLPLNLMTG